MKQVFLILSTGFALFSMFFGSGNLVFPIAVGQQSEGHPFLAAAGILLTGVAVPFLGVFAMMLYDGDLKRFFRFFGKKGVLLFSFLSLGLMGPFGVLARCLTVAHGALTLLIPGLSLPVASFAMCLVVLGFTLNRRKIISLLGAILTPALLLSIAAIAYFGLQAKMPISPLNAESWIAFQQGFFQGYQTMDLLAAFFFSGFVMQHLRALRKKGGRIEAASVFLKTALIGASLLGAVYFFLVLLGWEYSPMLEGAPPQEMLGVVALESLGAYAAPAVCVAVLFACLTTAIVLTSLFAEFLRHDISKGRLKRFPALIMTLAIGFSVSTLEFSGIAKFIGPILEMFYPALIALTFYNIAARLWQWRLQEN